MKPKKQFQFMLTLFIVLSMIACCSCGIDETVDPVNDPVPCAIAYLEYEDDVVFPVFTNNPDTIWVLFELIGYGMVPTMWIDGQIQWECLAIRREIIPTELTLMTRTDTCIFTIKPIDQ